MNIHRLWVGAAVATSLLLGACTFVVQPEGPGSTPPAAATGTPQAESTEGVSDNELVGTSWQWEEILIGGDAAVAPENPENYTLSFLEGGQLGAQIDCNQAGGTYEVSGNEITIELGAMTLMGCMGASQEEVFIDGVSTATSYILEGDTLTLTNGANPMRFTRITGDGAEGEATGEPSEEATAEPDEEAMGEDIIVNVTWGWQEMTQGDGTVVAPSDPSFYTITLLADGNVQAQIDCNNGMGSYTLEGPNLSFGPLATTRMACGDDSQDGIFTEALATAVSYTMDGENLVLSLGDGGTMTFVAFR